MPPVLRPYQAAALEALHDYLLSSTGFPLIEMATGTGKSLVIAAAAQELARSRRSGRFVVLAPRQELIEQDVAAIKSIWPEAPVGIVCEGLGRHDWQAPIVVATVNSIYRSAHKLGRRELAFVDEAHLIPHGEEGMFQTSFSGLMDAEPSLRIVGLTATPYRLDSGRLDEGDGRLFDQVIFRYGIADGIADGYLSPLVAKAPSEKARIDPSGVRRVAGEFSAGELERAADQERLVAAAAEEIVEQGRGRRSWLVFCCGIRHAVHVRDALRLRGVDCETVSGETPTAERRAIIEAFRRGEIRCLTGADIFVTGFDVPQVDLVALLRPTLSTSRYVQMIGRGTRIATGKANCLVLDFGGNVARHGPVDNPCIRTAINDKKDDDQAKVCPRCKTFNPLEATRCIECDREFERKSRAPVHAGTAATLPLMATAIEWIPVRIRGCFEHGKPGRPPTFQVAYSDGERDFRDWLAFEHGPGARWHAVRKWQQLGGQMPAPATTFEAIARRRELARDVEIVATFDGKFWRVERRRVRDIQPANLAANVHRNQREPALTGAAS